MVAIKFALVAALSAAPAVLGFEKYLATLPNGSGMGKKLGHTADGYTPFGDLYKSKGGAWATLCKEKYPGSSVSVGAALGDPCCKWTAGGAAQETLTAPNTSAKECAAASPAPAASSAAPAASPAVAPAPAPAPAPAAGVPSPAPTPAPAGPGKVLPAVIPAPAPASGNATKPAVPGPAPTPAASGKGGKATGPTKICT